MPAYPLNSKLKYVSPLVHIPTYIILLKPVVNADFWKVWHWLSSHFVASLLAFICHVSEFSNVSLHLTSLHPRRCGVYLRVTLGYSPVSASQLSGRCSVSELTLIPCLLPGLNSAQYSLLFTHVFKPTQLLYWVNLI